MRTVVIGSRKVDAPEYLDELSPSQYRYLLFLSNALAGGTIGIEYFKTRWLSHLLGLGDIDIPMLRADRIARIEEQTAGLVDGFLDSEGRPLLSTCRNLLPEWQGHNGPGDWLNGMTYGEVVECATALEAANAGGDEAAQAWEHIARVMYHYDEAARVDPLLAQHSVMLLASVWRAITTAPIEINGKMIDFSIIFKGTGDRRADDKTGWTGITFEVATAGLFGPVKDVEAADFWAVLMYLYKCKFEYNRDKSSTKR